MPGLLVAMLAVGGCGEAPSPLDPRTPAAARIAELGWVMIGLATVVCVVVFAALIAALRVVPRDPEAQQRARGGSDGDEAERVVVLGGMVVPAAILAFTFGYTVYTLREVAGMAGAGGASAFAAHDRGGSDARAAAQPAASSAPPLAVHLTGQQWWWQVEYPDAQVVAANEVHVPAGVPVHLTVTSRDVIHSFWVPQVTGKVDLIPGKVNALTLRADQPGVYRGLCGEFCGLQHARMHFRLIVDPPDEFARWLDGQRRDAAPPATPDAAEGQRIFLARCAECHTVRGTAAAGTQGPDLTHLASRRTLGAGIHENTRENLAGWTTDAQAMKVGNKMPSIPLDAEELRALLAYLEGLE